MDNELVIKGFIVVGVVIAFLFCALVIIYLVLKVLYHYKHDCYRRKFVFYFYHNGWDHISLGLHFDWVQPKIEFHIPFGFMRLGWSTDAVPDPADYKYAYRTYGIDPGVD